MSCFEIIIAIAGVIVLIFATWIPLHIFRIGRFNKVADAFHTTFIDVITVLTQNIEGKREMMPIRIITNEVLAAQEKAKIPLERLLPKSKTKGFNAAWENYVNCRNSYQKDNSKPDPQIREESQYCLKHIEDLLIYAKPK